MATAAFRCSLNPYPKMMASRRDLHLRIFWIIAGLFAIVLISELATPPDYVFGYLYVGPILLANSRLSRATALKITVAGATLTLTNLWVPGGHDVRASTIASRLIAILALVITAVLSDRNRRYEEALAQQQAKLQSQEQLANLREDFASTLTHDLKTPLLGAIETLKAFQQENFGIVVPAQQQVLAMMVRSHQTSLQFVETLLDVYRNDTQGLALQLAPVDLTKLAEEVTSALSSLAQSRRIHISLSFSGSDFRQFLWVNGDAFQLHRVFANLLTNAINHSTRGSAIEVELQPQSSHHIVKILDSGAGITNQELPHLFERFYQGNSDRQAKGSGLGLYLTRQIIEAHGGTIWAEKRLPTGAIFAFRLPALSYQSP
jgi:two-component system, NarL family, sensor kinase